jgi:hypothetical protein
MFLTFQDLRDTKKGKVKEHGLEISRRTKWDKVGRLVVNELQTRPGGAISPVDRATQALFRLERLMTFLNVCFSLYWPNTYY